MPRVSTAPYLSDRLEFLDLDHERFHRPLGVIERAGDAARPLRDGFVELLLAS